MLPSQEEALYIFLENAKGEFTLDEVVSYIKKIEPKQISRLAKETETFIKFKNLAFSSGTRRWVSRRGFFEPLSFVISPTRLELLNGILITGHRCVPFANTNLLPQEITFFCQGSQIPFTTVEGSPEEFYPYYSIFGEEYAPQYIARDNSENEEAFNSDPYDEPVEVSIKCLDMRGIYRETSFVPGDRFIVNAIDWKEGHYRLEKAGKDDWSIEELDVWSRAAEDGFDDSFKLHGPASCTEEQIAYAYWYGGKRIRSLPAYALEEFLYKKTSRIETTAYGIETRFWYSGKELPDFSGLDTGNTRPDKTYIEEILAGLKVPVSEYVIQSYVRDSLYREGGNEELIISRLLPAAAERKNQEMIFLYAYIREVIEDYKRFYSPFADKVVGPIRQRAGEMHTAVIELAARLSKGGVAASWLPRHTFIILSQIQSHAAGIMEDMLSDESFPEAELEALDNSLDSMIETYEDVKELIEEAMDNFRRNKLAVVRPGNSKTITERIIQLSISGIDAWRRVVVDEAYTLADLHQIIQVVFGWHNSQGYRFRNGKEIESGKRIGELETENMELVYEYGTKWTVRIMLLSRQESSAKRPVRCMSGSGTAPPEFVAGPLRFRKVLSALENGSEMEKHDARRELGLNFVPAEFDLEACNRKLSDYQKRSGSLIEI